MKDILQNPKAISKRELVNELVLEVFRNRDLASTKEDSWYDQEQKRIREMDLSWLEFRDFASKEELIEAQGRQWKHRVSVLIPMLETFKHCTSREYVTALTLQTTGYLKKIYGNNQNASNAIRYAIDCGLIAVAEDTKHFGDKHSKSYVYGWNKKVQDWLLEIVKENGLIHDVSYKCGESEESSRSLLQIFENGPKDISMRDFNRLVSQVHIGADLKINASDWNVVAALCVKYPALVECCKLADELNQQLPMDEQFSYEPTIHRSRNGLVSKIGFRPATRYSNTKDKDDGKHYNGVMRRDFMNQKFGGKWNWQKYDVKSSVPKIAYALNHGEWLGDDVDLYAKMLGVDFFDTREQRDAFKNFFMRCYFDTSSARISNRLRRAKVASDFIDEYSYSGLCSTVETIKEDIFKAIGKSIGSEIFLWESLAYLRAFRELLQRGAEPKLVYDCFYTNRSISLEEVSSIVCESVMSVVDHYCKSSEQEEKPTKKSRKTKKAAPLDVPALADEDIDFSHSYTNEDIQREKHREKTEQRPQNDIPLRSKSSIQPRRAMALAAVARGEDDGMPRLSRDEEIRRYNQQKQLLIDFIYGRITKEEALKQKETTDGR